MPSIASGTKAALTTAANGVVTAATVLFFFMFAIALAWPKHHFGIASLLRIASGLGFTSNREPALSAILERLPATIELLATSVVLAVVVSFALAAFTAISRKEGLRRTLAVLGLILACIPFFWLLLFAQLFATVTGALPQAGIASMNWFDLADRLRHVILPASLLALFQLPGFLESFGTSLTSNAGGKIVALNAFRCFGRRLPQLVAAGFLVEIVFAWPGVGRIYWNAVNQSNAAFFVAVTFLSTLGVIAVRLAAEAIGE